LPEGRHSPFLKKLLLSENSSRLSNRDFQGSLFALFTLPGTKTLNCGGGSRNQCTVEKFSFLYYTLHMLETNELNQMIERFEHFDLDDKEYLVDIFSKELREEKREKIYQRYLEAKENRKKGKIKIGDIRDLKADLE
jgi:hypothetical protein